MNFYDSSQSRRMQATVMEAICDKEHLFVNFN